MLLSLPPSAKESGTCPTMMLSAIAICVLACTFFAPVGMTICTFAVRTREMRWRVWLMPAVVKSVLNAAYTEPTGRICTAMPGPAPASSVSPMALPSGTTTVFCPMAVNLSCASRDACAAKRFISGVFA